MTINFFNDPLPCLGWSDCETTIAFCSKTSRRFRPVWTAWRLVLVYDQWFLHMIDLQTFEACTCHCHFWSMSRLALCLPFNHIICCGSLRMNSIIKAGQRAGSLSKVEMEFCLRRCIVTPSLFSERLWQATPRSFFKKNAPSFSDLSQLINRGPFYLQGKQVVMIVSQYTYDERVSASMCFLFGMLHLLTHRFGRDAADISGYDCNAAQNTTTHACSAVSGHSTVRAMCCFNFIPWRDCCRTVIHMAECNDMKNYDKISLT